MLETGINIIECPSLQYCTMSTFGGDALQRLAMSHKSSFIIKDYILESTGWAQQALSMELKHGPTYYSR